MAGSADVTGIQYYTYGIGQPRAEAEPEQAPLTIKNGALIFNGSNFGNSIVVSPGNGQAFDTALVPVIAAVRLIAAENGGRAPVIRIMGGTYVMSGTGVTITIEPWMRIVTMGNVEINAPGHTVPVFWERNDVTPIFDQGIDSENNNACIIDGSQGVLAIVGNRSAGGVGIRRGNGDGVWGTADIASPRLTFLSRVRGLNVTLMDHGIQITNNNTFCLRHSDVRITSCNKGLVTSTGANFNSFETTTFDDCFFNNMILSNVELNSPHQLSFIASSLTYCEGGNIIINADHGRVHLVNGRVENGDFVSRSNGAFLRSYVQLSNMTVTPTQLTPALLTHLRLLFQGQHVVQLSNVIFDMTGTVPNDLTYSNPDKQYLCDANTEIQWSNIRAVYATSSVVRRQPQPSRQSLVPNGGMVGNITGWTVPGGAGSIIYSTAQSNSGAGSLSASITAGQLRVESASFPVQAGRYYSGDAAFRLNSAPAPTTPFFNNFRFNWYALDNSTLLSSSGYVAQASIAGFTDNWILSAVGTGPVLVPSGAAYARIEIATNSGHTGNLFIDDVMVQEL